MSTLFTLECPKGSRRSSCGSEETARSSCGSEMDRSSCSSEGTERSSCGSDVVMMNDRLPTKIPGVKNLNVTNSKRVVVGPQFVTVTQNFEKINVVKDLSFYRYICNVARNSSKAEKASCGTAVLVLIICIMFIIYFTVIAKSIDDNSNLEPDEWFINRERWLAIKYNKTQSTSDNLRLVVIAHTTGPTCTTFIDCTMAVKNLQKFYIYSLGYDIPYSFLIGGDGRVYEGRGWNIVGAHTLGYNTCSMGLAFIGDYRKGLPSYSNVTDLQQQRAHMLFEEGVKNSHLHPHFHVLGAMDLRPTESPGTKLYNAIRKWPNYDHANLYKDKNCRQIEEIFENVHNTVSVV